MDRGYGLFCFALGAIHGILIGGLLFRLLEVYQ